MVSPGQLDKCSKVFIDGVQYTIAFRKRSWLRGNVVTYVHTQDPNFRSPEGLRIGDTLLVNKEADIVAAPGFEIYVRDKKYTWEPVVGFCGELTVALENAEDRKLSVRDLRESGHKVGVRLRILGFTKWERPRKDH